MILWKFTLREVKSRPGRATLTLLSIVIGVAAVVAVALGTSSTNEACQTMYVSLAGKAALEITAAGDGAFDEDIAATVAETPGVQAAVGSVQRWSALRYHGTSVRLMVMGIDLKQEAAVREYDLAKGKPFEKKYDALLETGFARGLGVKVGDEVKLDTPTGKQFVQSFRITGLLSRGAANFSQGGVIFLPLKTAERCFCDSGNVNMISVVLAEGADEKSMAQTIQSRLPTGLTVTSPAARSQLSKETIRNVEQGLDFAYIAILALAFFMILNTFLMNVGERRRQLAVLRAIGTTRRQIIGMLLWEGLALGVVGTLLGCAAGVGGALALTRSMGQVYGASMPPVHLTPRPFVVASILGPTVSLVAMFFPAWLAGKVSPLEGMRFVASEGRPGVSLRYVLVAMAIFLLTGSVMTACMVGYLPIRWMIVSGVIFTAAFVLLVPALLGVLTWLVATVTYPLLRTEGRIAHRQFFRRRARTTLTIGILYIAVSTAVSLGTTILNNVADIQNWVDTAMKGDFFVRALQQELGDAPAPKMPEVFVNDLRAIPGVSNVDSIRYLSGSVHLPDAEGSKQAVAIYVRDFTDHGNLPLVINGGDVSQVRQRLSQGEIVLGAVLAHQLHVAAGDEITLDTSEGPKRLRVAGTATVYRGGGKVIYMEGQTARRLLNAEGVDMYVVTAAPGALTGVETALKSLCGERGMMVHSFAELRRRVDEMMRGVIAGLWGLLALGLVVGAFGIANTLTMNVLEQTRELALLRVVAMTRWQVRKTILAQAVIIGVIGLAMGIAGGVIGCYVINLTSVPLMGYAPPFALQPSLMLLCFALGLVVILAAAWLPAERAARLNLLIALQYE